MLFGIILLCTIMLVFFTSLSIFIITNIINLFTIIMIGSIKLFGLLLYIFINLLDSIITFSIYLYNEWILPSYWSVMKVLLAIILAFELALLAFLLILLIITLIAEIPILIIFYLLAFLDSDFILYMSLPDFINFTDFIQIVNHFVDKVIQDVKSACESCNAMGARVNQSARGVFGAMMQNWMIRVDACLWNTNFLLGQIDGNPNAIGIYTKAAGHHSEASALLTKCGETIGKVVEVGSGSKLEADFNNMCDRVHITSKVLVNTATILTLRKGL